MKLPSVLLVLISTAASVAAYPDPTPSPDKQRQSIQTAIAVMSATELDKRYDINRAYYVHQMVQHSYFYDIVGFPIKGSQPSKRDGGVFEIRLDCLVFIDKRVPQNYYLHELTKDDTAQFIFVDESGKSTGGYRGNSEPRPPKQEPKRIPNYITTTNKALQAIGATNAPQPER